MIRRQRSSACRLLVPKCIIRPVVSVSALAWFVGYTYTSVIQAVQMFMIIFNSIYQISMSYALW